MKRALLLILFLLTGCSSMSQHSSSVEPVDPSVFPLEDYEAWDNWERAPQDFLVSNGYGKIFALVGINVTDWWVILVEPGTYTYPVLTVTTDEGTYSSDFWKFASPMQQRDFDPPITVDLDGFERYTLDGEERVVAFAHFSEAPKGQIQKWEVSQ